MTTTQGTIRRRPNATLGFAGLRAHRRRPLDVDVLIQDAQGWELPVESVDFSAGGIFVRTPYLLEEGTVQTLIFGGEEDTSPLAVRARVIRVERDQALLDSDPDYSPGMAFEFLSEVPRKKERLQRFARQVPA